MRATTLDARQVCALLLVLASAIMSTACVTVRPQERAVLADPTMQFEGDPQTSAQLNHAIENREGSYGGSGVSGGGCGCN
ncbi:MAG TPA: DUF4266 domain-containing protein [Polyangiaceae bacterium]